MQSTKDKILSVVIDYIKNNVSLDNMTLSKIAESAEIGKSTVYEHFSSKEQLITETYQYLLDHYRMIMMTDLKANTFKEQFIEQISLIADVMSDARLIVDAIMNHQEAFIGAGKQIEDTACEIQENMQKRFLEIFLKGVEEGVLPYKEPKPFQANVIQAIISGLLYQYANGIFDIEKDDLLELIYQNVLIIIKS